MDKIHLGKKKLSPILRERIKHYSGYTLMAHLALERIKKIVVKK